MSEYRIKPWEGSKRHPLTNRPPFVGEEPPRLMERRCLPGRVKPRPPTFWQLPAVLLFKAALLGLVYSMLEESLDLVGVNLSKHFIDDPFFGWVLGFAPNLTPRHVLALLMAFLFIGVPIYVWSELLGDSINEKRSLGQAIVRTFLFGVYACIVVAEYVLINHRIEAVQNNAFGSPVTLNATVAVFFSLLFVLVTATSSLVTASILRSRKLARRV